MSSFVGLITWVPLSAGLRLERRYFQSATAVVCRISCSRWKIHGFCGLLMWYIQYCMVYPMCDLLTSVLSVRCVIFALEFILFLLNTFYSWHAYTASCSCCFDMNCELRVATLYTTQTSCRRFLFQWFGWKWLSRRVGPNMRQVRFEVVFCEQFVFLFLEEAFANIAANCLGKHTPLYKVEGVVY